MPVDVSSYPSANVQSQDPLAMIGKVLQIQQAQNQIANFQQEYRARQALGPILQQSIDPKTGELDIGKFLVSGAANPDVAWKMPEITLQMIQRQNTQADTVLKTLNAEKIKWNTLGGAAMALKTQAMEDAAKKINVTTGQPGVPEISGKQLTAALSELVATGLMESKDAAEFAAKAASMSPADRFKMVSRIADSSRDIDKGLDAVHGAISPQKFGGGTAMVQSSPRLGTSQTVGTIEEQPTPGERNALVETRNKQGQVVPVPRAQVAPMQGGMGSQAPGTGAPAGGVVTGLSPNETKLQEERAKSANEYHNDLVSANTVGQENLRVLREMQEALRMFKSGGGMEVRERMGAMLDALGFPRNVVDAAAGGDRGAIQEFQKLAVRYATQEMKTNMGTSQRFTNLDFSTFLKNNPTIATDPRGLDKMFRFLEQGVWRAGQQLEYYQRWQQGERPRGYENSDMSSFPAFWTKMLEKANEPAGAR